MFTVSTEELTAWLKEAVGPNAELVELAELGKDEQGDEKAGQGIKGFGYGKPLFIRYRSEGTEKRAVLSVMRGDKYGHQHYWDRARILMFQYETSGRMEKHAKPLGLGYVDADGRMTPMKSPQEFFIVGEMLDGYDYYKDLDRIRGGDFRPRDAEQAREFARFLADLHDRKKDDPDLYVRFIRNLVGDGECIFGLIDAYPHPYDEFPPERFMRLEKRLIDWRWRLRTGAHRLSAIHGDFHPWNILVNESGDTADFGLLDRSRAEYGEPGDDVACLSINYLLFGLLDLKEGQPPQVAGPFLELFLTFWREYLERSGDADVLTKVAPFFVFRGLVVASPEWYPNHAPTVRRALFRFLENVLDDESFDFENINAYLR